MTSRRRSRAHRSAGVDRRARAAENRKPPTSAWGKEGDSHGVMVAWCSGDDVDALEEAKKATHDAVLEQLGDDRTGPVSWRFYVGDDADKAVDGLARPDNEEWMKTVIRPIRGRLREYGGVLVVATAPAITPS